MYSNGIYHCTICIENDTNIDNLYILPCNHGFHYNCLFPFYEKQMQDIGEGNCPLCREEYDYTDGYSYSEIIEIINYIYTTYNRLYPKNELKFKDDKYIKQKNNLFDLLIKELQLKFNQSEIIVNPDKSFTFKYFSINVEINWFINN